MLAGALSELGPETLFSAQDRKETGSNSFLFGELTERRNQSGESEGHGLHPGELARVWGVQPDEDMNSHYDETADPSGQPTGLVV